MKSVNCEVFWGKYVIALQTVEVGFLAKGCSNDIFGRDSATFKQCQRFPFGFKSWIWLGQFVHVCL